MKPVRQKRQEALERRKKDLTVWESTPKDTEIVNRKGDLLVGDERAAFLTRKVIICKDDIKKLEEILESTY